MLARAQAIALHIPMDQIRGLREIFISVDLDGDGAITAEELRQVGGQGFAVACMV